MSTFRLLWTMHEWVGIAFALLFLLVSSTGMLLLLKNRVAWLQPPEQVGVAFHSVEVSLANLLGIVSDITEMKVGGWADIGRIDVRPKKGMAKILSKNRFEAQVDLKTGVVLQVAYRRSDLIESFTMDPTSAIGFTPS